MSFVRGWMNFILRENNSEIRDLEKRSYCTGFRQVSNGHILKGSKYLLGWQRDCNESGHKESFMRQMMLVIFALFTWSTAFAEVFDCTFSEPAVNYKYNSKTEQLTKKKDLLGEPEIAESISFHILSSNIYVLKDSAGKQVGKITLSNNGSDGATETLYPYEIELKNENESGGCTSSLLKSVKR